MLPVGHHTTQVLCLITYASIRTPLPPKCCLITNASSRTPLPPTSPVTGRDWMKMPPPMMSSTLAPPTPDSQFLLIKCFPAGTWNHRLSFISILLLSHFPSTCQLFHQLLHVHVSIHFKPWPSDIIYFFKKNKCQTTWRTSCSWVDLSGSLLQEFANLQMHLFAICFNLVTSGICFTCVYEPIQHRAKQKMLVLQPRNYCSNVFVLWVFQITCAWTFFSDLLSRGST